MKKLQYGPRFLKTLKIVKKRHYDYALLEENIKLLCSDSVLPQKYRDHALVGDMQGFRDCHIQPNWGLIYQKTEDAIILIATGTHDDIFK